MLVRCITDNSYNFTFGNVYKFDNMKIRSDFGMDFQIDGDEIEDLNASLYTKFEEVE